MDGRLGVVTSGAFNSTLSVRLDPDVNTEDLHIGDFVVVEGRDYVYFSMIADLQLHVTDSNLIADPPWDRDSLTARALAGTGTFAIAQVKPMLMLPRQSDDLFLDPTERVRPVRTIPGHFSTLRRATDDDFRMVFGEDTNTNHMFSIGTPLTSNIPVALDLRRFMERSNGIFGQSGTGKSFLARLLLCGIIHREVGVNLVFDMHDEYAFGKESEEGVWVKGLKELFPTQVQVWSLDPKNRNADRHIQIGLDQIEPEDILLLAEELRLAEKAKISVELLVDEYRDQWFSALMDLTGEALDEFAARTGAHAGSVAALRRALIQVRNRPYVVPRADQRAIDELVALLDRGTHVILHFPSNTTTLDHMLVANIITRRVRSVYQAKVERYQETRNPAHRPRPLMITIEEAHKFLSPQVARQTIFGTIAREMRKYYVTLMVIDQRPSGIDREVLSQLGTRVTGKLSEEADIDAVLTGVGNRAAVRGALESLETKKQVLILGHAVPMPLLLRTREYDEAFYRSVQTRLGEDASPVDFDTAYSDLFGDE
ncbi:MAG: ATP-binding protein [Chloroflexi bacterium]|nr:ATP-binding protein [Chloroflexota bacterium]